MSLYGKARAIVDPAARLIAMASAERRMCTGRANCIAMMYEEADEAWVRALVSRAYTVASGDRKPYRVLDELSARIGSCWWKDGFKPPFGTPEEMIPE